MHYFADADISSLKSDTDDVYFNLPLINMVSYSFSWIFPMLFLAIVVFVLLIFFGIKKGKLSAKEVGRGFGALSLSLAISGLIGFFGWKLLLDIYPQYNEIQHGFTYNGHTYIAFFVMLSLAITFMVYGRYKLTNIASAYVAPIALWLIINIGVALYLKGAAYFIIPLFFGLLSFWSLIRQERPNLLLMLLLSAPAVLIFSPLIQFFPVGLGLKMLVTSTVLTVLLFGLILSLLGFYRYKRFMSILFFILAISFLVSAHFSSGFSETQPKPNSLIYYQDRDAKNQKAYWVTYDNILDDWTRGYLGEDPKEVSKYVVSSAGSKYNSGYTYASKAPLINLPELAIQINRDTLIDSNREVTFTILPQRDVHILRLYADQSIRFKSLTYNGMSVPKDSTGIVLSGRENNFLMHYNVSKNDSLEVKYSISDGVDPQFSILEYSLDLMDNPAFTINRRPDYTMPKPFVTTDAVIVKSQININEIRAAVKDTLTHPANQ
jgi:hypothetical protein